MGPPLARVLLEQRELTMMKLNLARVMVTALAALMLAGCTSGPGKYDVTVRPAESLRDPAGRIPSFEVDLIGVNPTEAPRLKSYSVNDYFSGADPVRSDATRKTMAFTAARPEPQVLRADDPIWNTWRERGATELIVMANIPGVSGGQGEDRRRLVLPLNRDRWKGYEIEVEVQRSGVVLNTPMNPES
jgi:hypothetical protein